MQHLVKEDLPLDTQNLCISKQAQTMEAPFKYCLQVNRLTSHYAPHPPDNKDNNGALKTIGAIKDAKTMVLKTIYCNSTTSWVIDVSTLFWVLVHTTQGSVMPKKGGNAAVSPVDRYKHPLFRFGYIQHRVWSCQKRVEMQQGAQSPG